MTWFRTTAASVSAASPKAGPAVLHVNSRVKETHLLELVLALLKLEVGEDRRILASKIGIALKVERRRQELHEEQDRAPSGAEG
jgi:hypothetical protein